jgi:hypothetical protein
LHINEGIDNILLFLKTGTVLIINKCNALVHGAVALEVLYSDHFIGELKRPSYPSFTNKVYRICMSETPWRNDAG